jgi:hypothetical protein
LSLLPRLKNSRIENAVAKVGLQRGHEVGTKFVRLGIIRLFDFEKSIKSLNACAASFTQT